MNELTLITILATSVVCLLLSVLVLQLGRYKRLQRQVQSLEKQVVVLTSGEITEPQDKSFSQDLAQVERSQVTPRPHQPPEVPDRYRYISAMAREGMSAAQIATALQIGESEAAQIVRLACLR